MTMHPEVMNDLLVIYLAGEASAETRELVEEYAKEHPEYAAKLQGAAAPLPAGGVEIREDEKMKSLKRTKEFVFLRTLFMAMGIAFLVSSFCIGFRDGQITFFLPRDLPGVFRAFLSISAASWVAWYVMHRQVRRAGL